MPVPQTTYLELSDPSTGRHKFYEVTVDGLTVTTRYGRIGTDGQTRTATFASPGAARVKAESTVAAKRKKGYAPATPGARETLPTSTSAAEPLPDAPVPEGSLFPYSIRFRIQDPSIEEPTDGQVTVYDLLVVGASVSTWRGRLSSTRLRFETDAYPSPEAALLAAKEKAAAKRAEVEPSGLTATVEESTYLERVDSDTGHTLFYEVIVDQTKLTRFWGLARHWRTPGAFPEATEEDVDSLEAGRAEAEQILRDLVDEGYRPAVKLWDQRKMEDTDDASSAEWDDTPRTYPEGLPPETRFSGAIGFEDLPVGAADAPTSDGQTLRFDPEAGYEARIEWSLTRLPGGDELPVDGVERRLWVPDADGRVWTAAQRSTAWVFYDALAHAQFENDLTLGLFDDADDAVREAFDAPLLAGVTLCDDDRAYRSLWLGDERIQFIFKYSELVFDLARVEPEKSWQLTAYHVRLRQGSDFDPSLPLSEIRHTVQLPEVVFKASAPPLDDAGAVRNAVTGSWETPPFPPPLVFELTDERGEPNEAVYVLPSPSAAA